MGEKLDDKSEWSVVTLRIPPELKDYGPTLTRFFDAMLFKLRRNSHKGKWEDLPVQGAAAGLQKEVGELLTAIKNDNSTEILTEAADVANFALITADIALEKRGV